MQNDLTGSRSAQMQTVRIARRGAVAIVTIDNPPVNALGAALREESAI